MSRSRPVRGRVDTEVIFNRRLCREHFILRLQVGSRLGPSLPGQFVQLGCRPPREPTPDGTVHAWPIGCSGPLGQPNLCQATALLRRPFSIAGRGGSASESWIEVIYRVVGVGTRWLADLRPGRAVDLIGPLGNAFGLPDHRSFGLMVGGGVGLPPMYYLAEYLDRAGWQAVGFVAAREAQLLAATFDAAVTPGAQGQPTRCAQEFARHGFDTIVTTDDGSMGMKGQITDGLRQQLRSQTPADRRRTIVFTCGPEAMMRAVAQLCRQHEVDCQACLEQAMACGMGTCQSCVVKIDAGDHTPHGREGSRAWRYQLTCTDGPVFDARSVVWGHR